MVEKEKWYSYIFVGVQMTTEENQATATEIISATRIFGVWILNTCYEFFSGDGGKARKLWRCENSEKETGAVTLKRGFPGALFI